MLCQRERVSHLKEVTLPQLAKAEPIHQNNIVSQAHNNGLSRNRNSYLLPTNCFTWLLKLKIHLFTKGLWIELTYGIAEKTSTTSLRN
jgi:hypothetical protein